MSRAVTIAEVSKAYRRGPETVHALHEVTLSLESGEVVALVGPSGSGKTTLLNVLAGWERPDSGRIVFHDAPDGTQPERLSWNHLAILPQSVGLVEELSVRENVSLPGRLGGDVDDAYIDLLLAELGLDRYADRAPAEISIGEQQRTGLARALVVRPTVLLADEPSGHQDAGWAKGVWEAIRRGALGGTACLVATHNQELLQFADRVLGIRDGHLEDVEHAEAHQHEAFTRQLAESRLGSPSAAPTPTEAEDERGTWGPST